LIYVNVFFSCSAQVFILKEKDYYYNFSDINLLLPTYLEQDNLPCSNDTQ